MTNRNKGKYIALIGAVLVQLLIILILMMIHIIRPEKTEESGVPVMLGEQLDAYGGFDPSSLVDVDVIPEQQPEPSPVEPVKTVEQEMITQPDEETVAIKPKTKKVEKTPKKKVVKPKAKPKPKKKVLTPQQKAAIAKRIAQEKAERRRKAAAAAAAKKVSNAFGKGFKMGDKGTTKGKGSQGVASGNSSTGATSGSAGYGTFDLGGRSLGKGGLPRPHYNVQEEGKVVVAITVNPQGKVISTRIHPRTNTVNVALRRAAERAARLARFNAVSGLSNQTGTITYYFNLK